MWYGNQICSLANSVWWWWVLFVTFVFSPALSAAEAPPPSPALQTTQAGVEVLARGPVHEAFAEPVILNAGPGPVIAKKPPAPVQEVMPDQAPAGPHVTWISGYWSWDEDRSDFIWVSGSWRSTPPGHRWIPGYWRDIDGGYQRVSGFWAAADSEEVLYHPTPPASLEIGPTTPAPGENHFWVPGCWVWRNSGYAWQPGFWTAYYADWDWVPPHYSWCPRGYVFVSGYWDHALPRRGWLFAPVVIDRRVSAAGDFRFYPRLVVDVGLFTKHLFVYGAFPTYYFGDYYDRGYADRGFLPWFAASASGKFYDPLYVHNFKHNGEQDRELELKLRADFQRRRDNANDRPAQTWARLKLDAETESDRIGRTDPLANALVKPLEHVTRNGGATKFVTVDENVRRDLAAMTSDQAQLGRTRVKLEAATEAKLAERIRLPDLKAGESGEGSRREVLKVPLENQDGVVTFRSADGKLPEKVQLPNSQLPLGGIQTDDGKATSRGRFVLPKGDQSSPKVIPWLPPRIPSHPGGQSPGPNKKSDDRGIRLDLELPRK